MQMGGIAVQHRSELGGGCCVLLRAVGVVACKQEALHLCDEQKRATMSANKLSTTHAKHSNMHETSAGSSCSI
jgi:hypothetical protein